MPPGRTAHTPVRREEGGGQTSQPRRFFPQMEKGRVQFPEKSGDPAVFVIPNWPPDPEPLRAGEQGHPCLPHRRAPRPPCS